MNQLPGIPPLRTERGSGAVDLVLTAAFILMPVAMLLLSFPLMVAYHSMGDAAAREAARACATAFDSTSGQERAERIAHRILGERGLAPAATRVTVDCVSSWKPDGEVTATVSFRAPMIEVVGIGSLGSVTVERSYRERIEPYRSWP